MEGKISRGRVPDEEIRSEETPMASGVSSKDRIVALQRMPIFGGIGEKIIATLLDGATITHRASGEYFFEQGDRGTSAFVLERGEVAILREYDQQRHLLRNLNTGDCFGEVALLDFGPRSASVKRSWIARPSSSRPWRSEGWR